MWTVDLVCDNKKLCDNTQTKWCVCVPVISSDTVYSGIHYLMCSPHCKESVHETLHPNSS